jgi:hypothetical protein
MAIKSEKMIEAFANPGWTYNESTHEMIQENIDQTRRFSFRHNSNGDKSSTALILSLFSEWGSRWDVFMLMIYENGDEVNIKINIEAANDLFEFDEVSTTVTYDTILTQSVSAYSVPEYTLETKRVKEDRKELLYTLTELPKTLDLEKTANLFIEQMVKGEMTRPVLVPLEANI